MKALVGSEVQTMNLSQTISLVHKPHLFTEFKTKQMNTWKHRNNGIYCLPFTTASYIFKHTPLSHIYTLSSSGTHKNTNRQTYDQPESSTVQYFYNINK